MMQGNIVFTGEACAVLREYKKGSSINDLHILFVHSLTTDVAFYVLNHPVCGIISEESSFATHGANILRCSFLNSSPKIVWITGVPRSKIEYFLGKRISITPNGIISEFSKAKLAYDTIISQHEHEDKAIYVPLRKKSIVDYNINSGAFLVAYWPHRNFNFMTFSVMRDALCNNLRLLGANKPSASLDESGIIWFENSPLHSELSTMAKNIEFALPILLKQIGLYDYLHGKLQIGYSLTNLVEMLKEYFSVFLLFHDTYEDVLVEIDALLKSELGNTGAYQAMNVLMCCKLNAWMLENDVILEKRKNLLSNEAIVILPQFTIKSDIEYCENRFRHYLIRQGFEHLWNSKKEVLKFYIAFFVAKEWKFVMNKILFTRFSQCIQELFPDVPFSEFESKDISEIVNLANEVTA